jgi:hypothetical protein
MRVTAAVAPRMASGDPAGAKGKSASGASFGKRRVGREERCAQPPSAMHSIFSAFAQTRMLARQMGRDEPERAVGKSPRC